MAECRIDYVELPSADAQAAKSFFHKAFGWGTVDYGPDYVGFDKSTSGLDGGINADPMSTSRASLVILRTDDLEAALAQVRAAGAEITVPIFSFPGGRRFHFRVPQGPEMAVWAE